jgi:hypothetical protein
MTNTSTVILAPFIMAFLVFIYRFYNRERASSVFNLSFMLAILTMVLAGTYLALGVTGHLPSYGTIGFACIGLIMFATAIVRIFMI